MKNLIKRCKTTQAWLALVALAVTQSHAADVHWTGATASYTNAASWDTGLVPTNTDNAISDNGLGNVVQVSLGDPNWALTSLRVGNLGSGALEQNGQTISLSSTVRAFSIGVANGSTGVYTLNDGAVNYGSGGFSIGELGTATMNLNGGALTGTGNMGVNLGVFTTVASITASMDGGTAKTGYTWFEQGFLVASPSVGIPTAGSTFASAAQPDHSFTMAASYTTNNAVMVNTNTASATLTFTAPSAYTALSLLTAAGNGPMTVNYTVTHADTTVETGSLVVPDWFSNTNVALGAVGRVAADGTIQNPGNGPNLMAFDLALTNTISAVNSVTLAYTTGAGVVCAFAISGSTGAAFTPITFTGYNQDMVVETGLNTIVSGSVTDTLNQAGGLISLTGGGQFFVGNYGNGIYNLSAGTNTVSNYIAFGRSGGNGTVNMTGGLLVQNGGGNLLVGTGYQVPSGGSSVGILNQSGGTITSQGEFLCPENSPSTGAYNLSGTGALVVNNWIAIGRNGGAGTMNISGGSLTKTGGSGSHIVVGAGGSGTVTQTGGAVTNLTSDTWIGENSTGTWNLNGGTANFSGVHISQLGSAAGTLNVNGGTLTVGEITTGNPIAFSSLNMNGGVIQASGSSANFIHDIFFAQVQSGGAIFDSQAFAVTIPQALPSNGGDGSGGLAKLGSGTLTLAGINTYAGPTIVQAGKLNLTTDSTGGGDVLVYGSAGLGVKVQALNAQFNAANAAFSNSVTTLDVDLGSFGNPTAAPFNVVGNLDVNGAVTVNIADGAPVLGQLPLVKYATKSGAGAFVLGSIPAGMQAYLSNNITAGSVDLVVTSAGAPRWEGTVAGGVWDVATTANWIDIGTAGATPYYEGNPVLLNDAATGTTTINLTSTVNPGSLTANNNSLTYTLAGTGKIHGNIGLSKQGSGTLAVLNTGGNDFTGPVVITGGTLTVTNLANGGSPSALGASSANPTNLVIQNSTFSYAGAPVTVNRGYSMLGSTSTIDAQGNLTLTGQIQATNVSGARRFIKTGPAQLTYAGANTNELAGGANPGYHVAQGTVLLDGSAGPQTNHIQQDLWVGAYTNSGGNLILSNSATLLDAWLAVGRGNGNINNTSTFTMYNSFFKAGNISLGYANGLPNLGYQSFVANGASSVIDNGALNVSENSGSTSALTVSGSTTWTNLGDINITAGGGTVGSVTINSNAVFGSRNRIEIGRSGGLGTMTIANSGKLHINAWFSIGNGNAGNGSVLVKDSGSLYCNDMNVTDTGTSIGTLSLQDSAVANGGNVYIGKAGGTVATLNMSGGTLISRATGGNSINLANSGGSLATANITGGNIQCRGELWVGQSGTANWNQTAGTVEVTNWIAIGRASGSIGTFTISGGSLTEMIPGSRTIVGSGGTGTLTLTNTAQVSSAGVLQLGENGTGNGTVNLSGGTLTVPQITKGAGPGVINFNGGTLRAGGAVNNVFLFGLTSANIKSGGLTLDSAGNTFNIGQPLLDGTGGGGLTKTGNGTLRLNGTNTFTGTVNVNVGSIGGTGILVAPVVVASTAGISPGVSGIGTLTVSNTVTLNAVSTNLFEVNVTAGTKDLLQGVSTLTYGGTLVVSNLGGTFASGNSFKLFDATTYAGSFSALVPATPGAGLLWNTNQLAVNGTLAVVSAVNTNPTNLVSSVSGNTLNLSWPNDYLGWRLLVQTNALTTGLGTNWFTWPNSTNLTSVSITLDPASPSVFFKMVYP